MTVSRLKLRREFAGVPWVTAVWPTAVAERLIHSAIAAILSPPRRANVRLGIDLLHHVAATPEAPAKRYEMAIVSPKQAALKPINKPITRLPNSN
jgi:hypothetical protein